jgi:hypothetical protein
MPKLREDRSLKRDVKVYGIEGEVVVDITRDGISFKAKGTRVGVSATWPELIGACPTPGNLPSKFNRQPYAFLQFQGKEQQKRMQEKLKKEIAKEIQERS